MLKDLYKYLSMMLVAVFAAACADLTEESELPDSEVSRYITFENFDVETKVTNDNITTQEFAIWVFDENHKGEDIAQTAYIDGSKYRLKYHEGSWRFYDKTSESYEDIEWGNGKHVFLAFSDMGHGCQLRKIDYNSPSNSQFNFVGNVDLRTNSLYKNDLLCCVTSVETVDYKPVKMQFSHVLSSLKFVVHNNSGTSKTISDFNLNSLKTSTTDSYTTLNFSDPTSGTWFIRSIYSADYMYLADDVTLNDGESCVMFGSPVAVYPQDWSGYTSDNITSGYNIPKLEMTIDGVETVYSFKNDFGHQSWLAGRLYTFDINIGPLSPTVEVQHVQTAGVLTHSAVKLNMGLADEQLLRISDLTVTVSKGGKTYKNQTFDSIPKDNNGFPIKTLTVTEGGYLYLPQGDGYEVAITYNLLVDGNKELRSTTINTTSPAPPAYSIVLNVTAEESACTIDKGVVQGISEALLNEVNLTYNGEYALAIFGDSNGAKLVSDNEKYKPGSSTFVNDFTFSGNPTANGYQISCGLEFDGVSPSIEYDELTDCVNSGNYITFIPPLVSAKVGDYFYSDGTYSTDPISGKTPVGIVFYVEDPEVDGDKPTEIDAALATACAAIGEGVGTHGLVVAVTTESIKGFKLASSWETAKGYSYNSGRLNPSFSMTGYTNTTALLTKDKTSGGASKINNKRSTTIVEKASFWYYPTFAEFDVIFEISTLEKINSQLEKVNETKLPTGTYWTVTESTDNGYIGIYVLDSNLNVSVSDTKTTTTSYYALPIFAF